MASSYHLLDIDCNLLNGSEMPNPCIRMVFIVEYLENFVNYPSVIFESVMV